MLDKCQKIENNIETNNSNMYGNIEEKFNGLLDK
jgi:hypothetical protein